MTRQQPKQSTVSTTQSGCDNLDILSMTASSAYPLGAVILSGVVTAESSARLATLSRAYQRVRWNALRFTIEGAFPTTAGGGYVTCFVRDPTDVPPEDPREAVRWAMAQQHSSDNKWYDSTGLAVGRSPGLLYTSMADGLRFSSPGTFYIISKGGPAQVGSLTVNFHWNVTLSEPTIEVEKTGNSIVLREDMMLPFTLEHGPMLLGKLVTASPSPHDIVLANATTADLGMENQAAGVYLSLAKPVTILGEYNTLNDYVPIYVSGFVVNGDQTLTAVYTVGSTEFYSVQIGEDYVPPGGISASNWHLLTAGIGALLEPGTELTVMGQATSLVPTTVDVFTAKGRKTYQVPGRKMVRATVGDEFRATMALSGEPLRA